MCVAPVWVYMFVCVCVYLYTYVCACIDAGMPVWVCVFLYVCICVCLYVCLCVFVCVRVCMPVCVCARSQVSGPILHLHVKLRMMCWHLLRLLADEPRDQTDISSPSWGWRALNQWPHSPNGNLRTTTFIPDVFVRVRQEAITWFSPSYCS